ncbi:hypothetical protein F2Q69_00005796 [Brassica cretica]|uniref:Uncharacterized protein n=1 Tax=Brassica cretica TaxID=69181 RepID=A0A8S9P8Z0_BRACR|nr:hypothetical protein F2Q69_00005796 [Brassica cretica]
MRGAGAYTLQDATDEESSVSMALGFSPIPGPSNSDSGFLQKQHAARELDSSQVPSGRMQNPNRVPERPPNPISSELRFQPWNPELTRKQEAKLAGKRNSLRKIIVPKRIKKGNKKPLFKEKQIRTRITQQDLDMNSPKLGELGGLKGDTKHRSSGRGLGRSFIPDVSGSRWYTARSSWAVRLGRRTSAELS